MMIPVGGNKYQGKASATTRFTICCLLGRKRPRRAMLAHRLNVMLRKEPKMVLQEIEKE